MSDPMLTVEAALALILAEARALPSQRLPLEQLAGLTLAEEIRADRDSPPHTKSLVDGYAVRSADVAAAPRELPVIEQVVAGQVPRQAVHAGAATRIMTGAPIPDGADAVVMIEETQFTPGAHGPLGRVTIMAEGVRPGQNVLAQGASMRAGEVVLRPGHRLRAIEIGLLAEVGVAEVAVTPRPRVAILPTGDELVDVRQAPSAGQVRNSNGPLLAAAVAGAGGEAWALGVAPDERKRLSELVAQGLEADMLLLSGGVSVGVLDLVPDVLATAGVRRVFHRVRLRPGKPLWFGVCEHAGRRTLVFGLPGNPVSSLVGFELFVRPALEALSGCVAAKDDGRSVSALLSQPYTHRGDRPTYQPARLLRGPDGLSVTPLPWQGSADLRALVAADCLACFPAGDRAYEVGERIDVLLLR